MDDFVTFGNKSGTIPNTGKRFLLKIASHLVVDVNNERNKLGLSYA